MRLDIDFYKAAQDYRDWVEKVVASTGQSDVERKEMLTLERFAIHLSAEWPKYAHAEV